MISNWLRLCLGILAAGAVPAQQTGQVLTLADCWKLAEAEFSLAERARLDARSAGELVRQARAGFLPQVAYENAFTYNSPLLHDRSTFSFVALNAIREYVSQPTLTEEVDLSGRLRATLARGRAEAGIAQARASITRRDLRLAVREAYYATLEARHNVEAAQRNVEEAEAFARRTRLMAEQGEAARADVVKAEVQLAARRRTLYAAQTTARNAGLLLKSFWSADLAAPPEIEDSFLQAPTEQDYLGWEAAWISRRSEFSLLTAAEQAARAEARLARSERRPSFNIVYAYGIDSERVRIRDRGQAVFANLRIPLFDWNRSRSRELQANLARRQVEIDQQIARRVFTGQFYSERNNVELAVKQMAEGKRETELARESLRLARLRYDAGETTALEVVEAQNTAAAADVAYNQAVFNYHMSRARLEVAIGQ
ncbi:MAG: TolC family protein [Acidobacteria bacterium]|nr:TolC family protein [Acidobacteriota bacterium]